MSVVHALRLIAWPYHAGLRDVDVGFGASALARDDGLRAALAAGGCAIAGETIPPVDETLPEVARIFELDRRLAARVAAARADAAFPLVLAGNCCSCLGTAAGAGAPGVVWFDAHADFDTPDDNLSGFTDVMGLAILTGSGWRALRETIPGFAPVEEADGQMGRAARGVGDAAVLAVEHQVVPDDRPPIRTVEVSADGGASWERAHLRGPNLPAAWVRWELPWTPPAPGAYELLARATDRLGNRQPATVPFNDGGYQFWAVARHPVVAA